MRLVGVLLAAGAGRRFGGPKLMQALTDGTPVAAAAASNLLAVVPDTIAVVRPDDAELIDALTATGVRIVDNSLAERGIGSSIAAAVRASADTDGWLIALGDMPWIKPSTIAAVASGVRRADSIVAPSYRGRRGHPVGFGSAWGADLQALSGDEGARGLIRANRGGLLLLDTDDAGVLQDIDLPRDLRRH